jgi:predicted amidophosphoribosyltransferase
MLVQGLKTLSPKKQINVLNVPTAANTIKKRGLDPVAIMTKNACIQAGKRFMYTPEFLINAKSRIDQAQLNFEERRLNLQEAFNSPEKSSKNFVIVDDVITTGSSMSSSILAMQERGNHVKACLVLALT